MLHSLRLFISRTARPSKRPTRSRGAVTTEYTVLVALVALGASAALVGLGLAVITRFEADQSLLLMPFP